MTRTSGLSKRFQEATSEQRLKYFDEAVVTDRSELSPEMREELEKADREMSERRKGRLHVPKINDMRTEKHPG